MNQKKPTEQLERAIRKAAPLLRRWATKSNAKMPAHLLKALRADLDRRHPDSPPSMDQLVEITLPLLAEASLPAEELVTAMRMRSLRVNDQHIADLISLLLGNGLIEEDLKASAALPSPAYRASPAARRILGLSNSRERIRSLLNRD
jgi:hypothetical protein